MAPRTGAQAIAQSLRDSGVTVIFGIVGIPVVEIAEEAIDLGIRFIGFRNEQAASYAAGAYGYLTGRAGVCLVVGGPGVLHAIAGVGNSNANAFPLLLLAGSAETSLVSRGAFQEMDAISLLIPHTKLALRPSTIMAIPDAIKNAYQTSYRGRPGSAFLDLPADLIKGSIQTEQHAQEMIERAEAPRLGIEKNQISSIADMIKKARAPLVVIGKGAAYSMAERDIRKLIDRTGLPFLPTPMGKGVVADSHPTNTASARSTALKEADVVLILGARLNWILHFGDAPKWNNKVRFIHIDISAEALGRASSSGGVGVVADIAVAVPQIIDALGAWSYDSSSSQYSQHLRAAKAKNEEAAASKAASPKIPMTYAHAFSTIEKTLRRLSPPETGGIVYISEGANTMDISRSIFPVSYPRLRLDAGTYATMGVGLGYAIAAHAAYNTPNPEGHSGSASRKKIVALEGDSAFGFSAMEVETMARYGMDVLIFVMNNGGIYHGDSDDSEQWLRMQANTQTGSPEGLRSTSLGWEVGYEQIAVACGGSGYLVRTPEELEHATTQGFRDSRVCIVNVMIEAGVGSKLEFGWQSAAGPATAGTSSAGEKPKL